MGSKLQLATEVILAIVSAVTSTGTPTEDLDAATRRQILCTMARAGVAVDKDFAARLPDYGVRDPDDRGNGSEQRALRTRTMRQVVNFYKAQIIRKDWLREKAQPDGYIPGAIPHVPASNAARTLTGAESPNSAALGHHPKRPHLQPPRA